MRYEYSHVNTKDAASLLSRLNELGAQGWRVVGWSYDRHDAMAHGALIERIIDEKKDPAPQSLLGKVIDGKPTASQKRR